MPADTIPYYQFVTPAVNYRAAFCSADTDTVTFVPQLDALLTAENANGYTFQPTLYAYKHARNYLEVLSRISGRSLPQPDLVPDGEGGVDIEWENGSRRVAISCRANPDQKDCIYWREIGAGGYEARDMNLLRVMERLRWLARA